MIKVIDVTSGLAHRPTAVDTTPMVTSSKEGTAEATAAAVDSGEAPQVPDVPHLLPKGLKQLELHVPSDEKDVYAYYYLLKVRCHMIELGQTAIHALNFYAYGLAWLLQFELGTLTMCE